MNRGNLLPFGIRLLPMSRASEIAAELNAEHDLATQCAECVKCAKENLDHNSPFLNLLASYLSPRTRQTNRGLGKKASHIGQEFVGGGFTPGSHGIDALVVGFYNGEALIYAARVRAGLVPATRRELYARVKPLIVEQCSFTNLPELKSGRWGQGLTAAKMRECIWVKPKLVANFELLEWTDTNHVRHIKFVGLRIDKNPRQVVRE